jgi:hypothetical protein
MYVPSIAHKIFNEMKKFRKIQKENPDFLYIDLAGIAPGNGWVDSRIQGPAVIDYAYFHGMYDMHTRDMLRAEWECCVNGKSNQKACGLIDHPGRYALVFHTKVGCPKLNFLIMLATQDLISLFVECIRCGNMGSLRRYLGWLE